MAAELLDFHERTLSAQLPSIEVCECLLEASPTGLNAMADRLVSDRPSTIDVLDRVLDKGIVIDGWWRMSLGGIDLISVDGRAVVASIETYLRYAPDISYTGLLRWPDMPLLSRLPDFPGTIKPEPISVRQGTPSGDQASRQNTKNPPSADRRADDAPRRSRARSGSKRRPY
jgi:gas vesicle structural protein